MGTKKVTFKSTAKDDPAKFYLFSTPAHQSYPSALIKKEEAAPVNIGSKETANERSIYKYIYLQGKGSCQLVMGLTLLRNLQLWFYLGNGWREPGLFGYGCSEDWGSEVKR